MNRYVFNIIRIKYQNYYKRQNHFILKEKRSICFF